MKDILLNDLHKPAFWFAVVWALALFLSKAFGYQPGAGVQALVTNLVMLVNAATAVITAAAHIANGMAAKAQASKQ